MRWERTTRAIDKNGTTIRYEAIAASGDIYRVESRKRAIPHSNRTGCWMHTSYFLIIDDREKEFYSLRDAKAAAEKMEEESEE